MKARGTSRFAHVCGMPGLRGRGMVVLTPLGVLCPHVINWTTLHRHSSVRVLLRNSTEWALSNASFLKVLDDAVPFRINQEDGPICLL